MMKNIELPYVKNPESKKVQVEQMFDSISGRYDFLNRSLSVGIDKWWRSRIIARLRNENPEYILDIATGTADVAIALSQLNPKKITGIDISEKMLASGRKKVSRKGLQHLIDLQRADSEKLPFAENSFDAITVAFGVRNFENLQAGLQEMCRVLRPGKKVIILEFSSPRLFPVKQLYKLYFQYFCPWWGKCWSKDPAAYGYLYRSVNVFPDGPAFERELSAAGFHNVESKRLTFGIVSIYTALK